MKGRCETTRLREQRDYETTKERAKLRKGDAKQQDYETTKLRNNERTLKKQRKSDAKQQKGETTKLRNNETAKGQDGPIRTS